LWEEKYKSHLEKFARRYASGLTPLDSQPEDADMYALASEMGEAILGLFSMSLKADDYYRASINAVVDFERRPFDWQAVMADLDFLSAVLTMVHDFWDNDYLKQTTVWFEQLFRVKGVMVMITKLMDGTAEADVSPVVVLHAFVDVWRQQNALSLKECTPPNGFTDVGILLQTFISLPIKEKIIKWIGMTAARNEPNFMQTLSLKEDVLPMEVKSMVTKVRIASRIQDMNKHICLGQSPGGLVELTVALQGVDELDLQNDTLLNAMSPQLRIDEVVAIKAHRNKMFEELTKTMATELESVKKFNDRYKRFDDAIVTWTFDNFPAVTAPVKTGIKDCISTIDLDHAKTPQIYQYKKWLNIEPQYF